MNSVLVTGASGFIGQATVKHLLQRGYSVTALIHHPNSWFKYTPSLKIIVADITDTKRVTAACKSCDYVVHLAALKSDESNSKHVNVIGTKVLVQACRKNKVKLLIHFSTLATKIVHKGIYATTKDQADQIVHKSALPYVILKPSVVYGSTPQGVFGSLVRFSRYSLVPIIGSGLQRIYPIHVDDVATAIERTIIHSQQCVGQSFDLGGPTEIILVDLVRLIEKQIHRKQKPGIIVNIPVVFGLGLASILARFGPRPLITVSNVLGSTQPISTDVKPFYRATQFRPRSLNVGLRQVKKTTAAEAEITTIWKYVAQSINQPSSPTPEDITAINHIFQKKHLPPTLSWYNFSPTTLLAADFYTRIFRPSSGLQKKLLIVAAFIETSPVSISLLPQNYSLWQLFFQGSQLVFQTTTSVVTLLLLLPLFLLRDHSDV